jgi:glycosyltransferase involved in cell wall biosynthesis
MPDASPRIAVIIPCLNEELTVAQVVRDFQASLPSASIYVFDNNSTDRTAEVARAAGAQVRQVKARGKGNVVRRMLADVDADIYVMTDGDTTYDAAQAPELVRLLQEQQLDIVIGARQGSEGCFPSGHVFGNWLFNQIVRRLFGHGLNDIFSGYRVMSRRFAKSFPAHSQGFETETEMSIHILEMRLPYLEVPSKYGARPEGSYSKLSSWRDGWRILLTILSIFRDARPLLFFLLISLFFVMASLGLGIPVVLEYFETGLVRRIPSAVLATGLALVATLSLVCGIILDGVIRTHREMLHMRYLNWPPVPGPQAS